jgi:hypothetical protein
MDTSRQRNKRDTPTYRELAQLSKGRLSLTTAWRRVNKGRPSTLTRTLRERRIASVVWGLTQDRSIREIALLLGLSRSAVERDRRVIRQRLERGVDVVAEARRTLGVDEKGDVRS